MKQAHSQVTENPAVCATRNTAKVQMGAMTPSFPPARLPVESPKDKDR